MQTMYTDYVYIVYLKKREESIETGNKESKVIKLTI